MLLYTHAINEERSRTGRPTVNSFWVSGTGALPSPTPLPPREGLHVTHVLRDAALLRDWPAWAAGWRQVDERDCAPLVRALDRGEQVALTLCGERNARTFAGAGCSFFGKLRASLRRSRWAQVLDSL